MTLPRKLLNWKISLLLACLLGLSVIIVACGGDDDDTPAATPAAPAPTAAPTMAPTVAATMAPTPTPTAMPTMAPTEAPMVPVSARLRVVIPPPTDQFTIPYAASQTTEKIMPIYDHLVGAAL